MENYSVGYSTLLRRDAPVIMGIVLRPLSLGHLVHLNSEKCAVIYQRLQWTPANTPHLMDELGKALLICSLTFEQYCELQLQPKVRKAIYKRWNRVIQKMIKKGLFNLVESLDDFYIYLESGCKDIPHVSPKSDSLPSIQFDETNWYVPMKNELCKEYGVSESEVLNAPFQKTQFDFYYLAIKSGAMSKLASKEDLDLMELNLHGGKI